MDEAAFKAKLTPEQYHVLREKGTEMPGTGSLLHNDTTGDYACAACGQVVFNSDTKFDSGSGWPSFRAPSQSDAVEYVPDSSYGMQRTEVICRNCGSHLGHVFDLPSGKDFCINSVALEFKPKS